MMVSKYKNKIGQNVFVMVLEESQLQATKNPKYFRVILGENLTIGVSKNAKQTVSMKLKDLVNLDKIPLDNPKEEVK